MPIWSSIRTQLLSMTILLFLWQLLCWQLPFSPTGGAVVDSQLLPSPLRVAQVMWQEWQSGELAYHLEATLLRVAIAFSVSMLLGSVLGVWMGLNAGVNRWLDPILVFFLNIPALVVIILFYIWMGMTEFAAIAAVVMNKVPNVVVTLRQGTWSLDTRYRALTQVYRISRFRQMKEVILPQLAPYLLVSTRSGLALIWKIVLVVELLGRSEGVGFQLHLAFQMFDVAMILAYSLAFILIVQAIEWLLLQPWEKYQSRWR